MTNSLTIHQHNLFQPARRRGNSPFRAPPLAAPPHVPIEPSRPCPLRAALRGRGPGAAQRGRDGTERNGGEGAPPPPQHFHAEPGSPARRHVNWISFTRGGGKAQGLGLQRRLGRFIQGFIERKKRSQGRLAARTQAHTHTQTHRLSHTHTHTQPGQGCFSLPVTPPPPGAGEAARGGCVIHFPGAEGDNLCGVRGVQPARRASRMPL